MGERWMTELTGLVMRGPVLGETVLVGDDHVHSPFSELPWVRYHGCGTVVFFWFYRNQF